MHWDTLSEMQSIKNSNEWKRIWINVLISRLVCRQFAGSYSTGSLVTFLLAMPFIHITTKAESINFEKIWKHKMFWEYKKKYRQKITNM